MAYPRQTLWIALVTVLSLTIGCTSSPPRRDSDFPTPKMPTKLGASSGIPWESDFVTMGSVQVHDTIYVAAQLSWDEVGLVKGDTVEAQMRQIYTNIRKLLERHSAKLTDVVEETVYVIDMKAAQTAAPKVRREFLGEDPVIASSLVEVKKLPDPKALVAIKATAMFDKPKSPGSRGEDSEQPPSRGSGRSRGRGMGGRGMGGGGYGGQSPY